MLLFDIDGTLIRTGGAGVKAFEKTFETEFNAPDATWKVKFAGRTDTSLVRECFCNGRIEPVARNFQRFFDTYVFWLHYLLAETAGNACPGVHELFGDLRQSDNPPLIGLLTGNIRLGAEIKLRHFDLWGIFEMGAFGDDHEDRNRLADIARERSGLMLDRKVPGDEVLVIGDTPMDVRCAEAIGAKSLAVCTGGATRGELERCRPTLLVNDLTEVTVEELCGL